MAPIIVCSPRFLPEHQWYDAAEEAARINPTNRPNTSLIAAATVGMTQPDTALIAVLTTKYWRTNGVHLGVQFLDGGSAAYRRLILANMNAWDKTANVKFSESTSGEVRIARMGGQNGGYWSYLGTDILQIPKGQQTMNLEEFTENTSESEFHRVVRHETGHTLGFPHEHMRRELVDLLDVPKTIQFFKQTQGWSEDMVRRQVLTPIEEASIRGTAHADPRSIMCYQIPGTITRTGQPIIGGLDIDTSDFDFVGTIYPKAVTKPPAKPAKKPAKKAKPKKKAKAKKKSKPKKPAAKTTKKKVSKKRV